MRTALALAAPGTSIVLASVTWPFGGSSGHGAMQPANEQAISAQTSSTEDGVRLAETIQESMMNSTDVCDVVSSGLFCYFDGRAALLPPAVPPGIVGHWTFDEPVAYDASGNGLHAVSEVLHGPSPAGGGRSAIFKNNFLEVPNSPKLQLVDMSYTFWVYLADAAPPPADAPHFCTLLRKGIYIPKAEEFANAPAVLFSPTSGTIRASITTSTHSRADGEFVDSSARLLPNRWMHLAVVYHQEHSRLLLYVNGILDNALKISGKLILNQYPLYVGGDPFSADQCSQTVYIDEVRAYSYPVAPYELQAEAAVALGGSDPSMVHLGCISCTLEQAAARCPANRHICSSLELHTGGYQVARAMGWFRSGAHVWTHSSVAKELAYERQMGKPEEASAAQVGLGLCCEGKA